MKVRQLIIAVLVGVFLVLFLQTAFAVVTETITCDAPTTRIDGSPFALTDISGYKVYYDLVPPVKGAASTTVVQFPITSTFLSLPTMTFNLDMPKWDTVYFYAVTVIDKQTIPQESALSGVVSKRTMKAPPSAPVAYASPQGVGVI